jgi:hypothetical protein
MKRFVLAFAASSSLCAADFFVTADFLYWFAKENDLSYALKVQGKNQIARIAISPVMLAPKKVEQFNIAWDPGFRIGFGFQPDCAPFDLYANWTYFHDEKKNHVSVPTFGTTASEFFPDVDQFALINPWINVGNFTSTIDSPFLFDSVSATWKCNLNVVDVEIGLNTLLGSCFYFRPYVGVRTGFLKLTFNNNASLDPDPSESVSFQDHFENRFWGVGLLAGIQPKWYFTPSFSLVSNIDAALLWGSTDAKKKENYFGTAGFGAFRIIDYNNHFHNQFSQFQTIIDLSLGLSWEKFWLCDRLCTAFELVWEQHFWFDAASRVKLNTAFLNDIGAGSLQFGFQGYEETQNHLIFGGAVLKARLDF